MRRQMLGFHGVPHFELKEKLNKPAESLSVALSRLKKNGLVSREGHFWNITEHGKKFLNDHPRLAVVLRHKKRISAADHTKKNMIIAFDIPERYRKKRNWLRIELINLGFIKIQKSFWFGPAPLPEDFIQSLHALALLPYLKFFIAREKEIV